MVRGESVQARGAYSAVSRSVVLSRLPSNDFAPNVHRAFPTLFGAAARSDKPSQPIQIVENVTHSFVMWLLFPTIGLRNRRSKAGRAMACAPKILLICTLLLAIPVTIASNERTTNDHRDFANHRLIWPVWPYREKFPHARHDRDSRAGFQQATTGVNNWSRNDPYPERSSSTIAPLLIGGFRHRVEHRVEQRTTRPEKFSAVAVAEYAGTRAIAQASYHNHRHQPREAVTQNYQHHTITPATYTKHHPG